MWWDGYVDYTCIQRTYTKRGRERERVGFFLKGYLFFFYSYVEKGCRGESIMEK